VLAVTIIMMLKSMLLASLLAATACKADEKPAAAPAAEGTESGATGGATAAKQRSGRIDVTRKVRPPAEGGVVTADPVTPGGSRTPEEIDARRRERMAAIDTDGDGKVSTDERKAARAKHATDLRKRLDADHDGKLTVQEIATSNFRRFDPEAIDANKDGDITTEELTSALEQRTRSWSRGSRRNRPNDASDATPTAPSTAPSPTAPEALPSE
jgi:hypothetical protein